MSGAKRPNPASLTRLAVSAQAKGLHEQALGLAEEVLKHFPLNPDALLIAGQSCLMLGDHERSVERLSALLQQHTKHAVALNNRGVALENLGRHEQALRDFSHARKLEPDYEDARLNEAQCLQRLDRVDEAVAAYEAILRLSPHHAVARTRLGETLRMAGREHVALGYLQQAVVEDPQSGIAWFALGNAHLDAGRWQEAVDAYGEASTWIPTEPLVYANCAKAFTALGLHSDALKLCDTALAISEDCLPAWKNKIAVFLERKGWVQAIDACHEVLKRAPQDARTHNNLGHALVSLGLLAPAQDAYEKASQLEPNVALFWVNQGSTLELLNRREQAWGCYQKALEIDEDYPELLGRLAYSRLYACDWRDLDRLRDRISSSTHRGKMPCDPFRIIAFSSDAADQYVLARSARPTANQGSNEVLKSKNPAQSRRIKIGYFSADFHFHATSILMAELLELHDKSRFELIAFSFGAPRTDAMNERIRKYFDEFHDIHGTTDDSAVQLARSLNLDIAVDLKGLTQNHRIEIFQKRVAPIQISYLGFPGTLGPGLMDYLIADRELIPDHLLHHYHEKIIRVPGTYQANDRSHKPALISPTREAEGLPIDGFVFCCFNNNYKIVPVVYDTWMRLLRRVDRSVLWLLSDNPEAEKNLRKEAEARGVASSRIIFAPRVSLDAHLARQHLADLFLDTLPCNAHTTASDALRVGLPVLTCRGTSFASRVASSLLAAQGLTELITENLGEYEEKAFGLATRPTTMAAIRSRCIEAITSGKLLDTPGLTQSIESAYELAHQRHSQGLPTAHIDI
jgi:protein O-GlcNAc transferase